MKQHFASIILATSFIIHLSFSLGAINNSLHGWHEFRQTQTALSVRHVIRDGISLNYKTPVVGAPWKVPMEFPIYHAVVYAVHNVFNGKLEAEGRAVSLLFFYLSLIVLFQFINKLNITSNSHIKIIMAGILLSNYYMYWATVFLIESTALFFSILFAYLLYTNVFEKEKTNIASWFLAILIGIIGMLAKITAFIPIVFPVLLAMGLFFLFREGFAYAFKKLIIPCSIFVICILVQYWWVCYADAIKAENPIASVWISSSPDMKKWNFGTLNQRLSPSLWVHYFTGLGHYVGALYVFVFLAAMYNSYKSKKLLIFNIILLTIFFTGPLIFFNLYKVHTYYSITTNLFFIAFILLNILELCNSIPNKAMLPSLKNITVSTILFGLLLLFTYRLYHAGFNDKYHTSKHENNPYNEFADYIAQNTNKEAYFIVCGIKLNANITYYIDRKSINTSLGYIENSANTDMLIKRNGIENFSGIISVQNDTLEIRPSIQKLWKVNPKPKYKKLLQHNKPLWLCYYK